MEQSSKNLEDMQTENIKGYLNLSVEVLDYDLGAEQFRCFVLFYNRCSRGTNPTVWGTKLNMAHALGVSRPTVYRAFRQAVAQGFLRRKPFMVRVSPTVVHAEEPLTCPLASTDTNWVRFPREWIYPELMPELTNAHDFRLLLEYVRHPDWYRTNKQLAEACHMKERQVQISRQRLVAAGLLKPHPIRLNGVRRYVAEARTQSDMLTDVNKEIGTTA